MSKMKIGHLAQCLPYGKGSAVVASIRTGLLAVVHSAARPLGASSVLR